MTINLELLRELNAKATPPSWTPSHNIDAPKNPDNGESWSPENPNREGRGEGPNHVGAFRDVKDRAVADAELIAAVRNALPALLDEVERLRKENAVLTAERDAAQQSWLLYELIVQDGREKDVVECMNKWHGRALAAEAIVDIVRKQEANFKASGELKNALQAARQQGKSDPDLIQRHLELDAEGVELQEALGAALAARPTEAK